MISSTRLFAACLPLLAGLALSACGGGGTTASFDTTVSPPPPSAGPASGGSAPATGRPSVCGKLQMKGNEQDVVLVKGEVPCTEALTVINTYVTVPKHGTDGAATVTGWTCRTATAANDKQRGYITICSKGTGEFVTMKP